MIDSEGHSRSFARYYKMPNIPKNDAITHAVKYYQWRENRLQRGSGFCQRQLLWRSQKGIL